MKYTIAIMTILVLLGCSQRKYDLVNGTVEVTDFLTKTELRGLKYEDTEIKLEINTLNKTPMEIFMEGYGVGVGVGRKVVAE